MSIVQVIKPVAHTLGPVPIRRILPSRHRSMVGPFIFMDQGGPLTLPNRPGGGVPEHPHAGLSTFTYLFKGTMNHADSAGNVATIQSGDIALMTSGSGLTHEELPDPTDRSPTVDLFFIQMWLALPDALEETDPAFEHYRKHELPVVAGAGATARLAMGSGWGQTAKTTCHVPTIFAAAACGPAAEARRLH